MKLSVLSQRWKKRKPLNKSAILNSPRNRQLYVLPVVACHSAVAVVHLAVVGAQIVVVALAVQRGNRVVNPRNRKSRPWRGSIMASENVPGTETDANGEVEETENAKEKEVVAERKSEGLADDPQVLRREIAKLRKEN